MSLHDLGGYMAAQSAAKQPEGAEPVVHDFRVARWGMALHWRPKEGGLILEGAGFDGGARARGRKIQTGHFFQIEESVFYRVVRIEYKADPGDMFFFKAVFWPRAKSDLLAEVPEVCPEDFPNPDYFKQVQASRVRYISELEGA